jgi:hypothetical protein
MSARMQGGRGVKRKIALATATGCAIWASQAHAAFVVDTGPGAAPPFFLIGPTTRSHSQFTLNAATKITGIEFYGQVIQAGSFQFSIAYTGVNEPGLFFAPYSQTLTSTSVGWHGVSGIDLDLLPGTYWLGLGNGGGTALAYHLGNASNPLGNEAIYSAGALVPSYVDADAFNFAWRVSGEALAAPPAAVPEPRTWAVLIAGFGAIGVGLRSRRRLATAAARLTFT